MSIRTSSLARHPFCSAVVVAIISCMASVPATLHAEDAREVITIKSLLQEMVDRDAVAQVASPYYQCRQASSWDRSQKAVNGPNWFANHDYDRYLRKETTKGRTEYVVMEDNVPGCVTRIWRPLGIGNELPKTTIRFYLDGSPSPAIEANFTELMSAQSVFNEPFSFIASDEKNSKQQIGLPKDYKQMGGDLYFPIPYAKNCKVTLEPHPKPGDAPHNVFFYIINYRSYESGTPVQTFTMDRYKGTETLHMRIGKALSEPGSGVKKRESLNIAETLEPGKAMSVALPGGSHAIRELALDIPPEAHADAVKDLWISIRFDEALTVWCPVSEFFGGGRFKRDAHPESPAADGMFIRPHWNRNRSVTANGAFKSWFVMPYQSSGEFQILNKGTKPIAVKASLGIGAWSWDKRSMHFHANWRSSETPGCHADWNYVEIMGQGTYVADTLSIFSRPKRWYGEGDERIYIDGESFPSHLGTGTEDYYGYAWGMANFFDSAFISAPPRDLRGKGDWSGDQTVSRERLLDAIPFKSSLKVDMEAWNGAGVHYSVGTMWYGVPGASAKSDVSAVHDQKYWDNELGDVSGSNKVAVSRAKTMTRIENGLVAVDLRKGAGHVVLSFQAKNPEGAWATVCESFTPDFKTHPGGNRFFDTTVTSHRYQLSEMATEFKIVTNSDDKVVVQITGGCGADVEQTLTLSSGDSFFHSEVSATLKEPLLDYVMSSFIFSSNKLPEFIHTPTSKKTDPRSGPARDQVIGDHAFHAPAIILQEGGLFAALVPDLAMINDYRIVSPDARRTMKVRRNKFSVPIEDDKYTMPTALDLNVVSGLTPKPVFSYGMMDFIIAHHMRYQRVNNESMIRKLNNTRVRYGFDLFLGAREPANTGYQKIARYQWERYGHDFFQKERHLAMPFEEYVKTVYGVVSKPMNPKVQAPVPGYEDHGVFIDFEMNGKPVGGMVSPLGVLGFGDALWNFEFWNNVRDASGMYHWGKKLQNPELVDRSKRIINLALEAPQNEEGFFSLVYLAQRKRWLRSSLGPSPNISSIFAKKNQVYNVPAMSKTAAHMLEYYERCEKNPRIVTYLRRYADGLLKRIDKNGCIHSYYSPDMKPIEALRFSAQPVATMWFLAEFYNVTRESKYLDGAENIAGYIIRDILPNQKWIDLEPYYSCGRNPLNYMMDHEQGLQIRGNLATFWATKGFAALFRGTGDKKYLAAGEQAIDYVSFSQACWDPHYIYTALPFGGFTVDNGDTATWLDARQCEMVQPFIWYGQTLGRQDLVERGIAAARSSVVLINHPLHKQNDIYRHTNLYGFGLGPENINHEGHNQSAMRTHPSWGECSGIFTGLADADRMLGGGIINVDQQIAVGVDGLSITSFSLQGSRLTINIKDKLATLKKPWERPYDTVLSISGCVADRVYTVVINDSPPREIFGEALKSLHCRVAPDGKVRANLGANLGPALAIVLSEE